MMDKNTVIGMLLMCAVIFGFMYFQPKDENAQNKQQAQTTEKTADKAASNASVDTLTAAEMTLLDTLTAKNGEITMDGVQLVNKDGKATGTIKIENKSIDLSALAVAKSDDPRAQNLAVQEVKKVLEKYAQASAFSANLTGEEKTIALENDSIKIEISTKGAMVNRATLKGYRAYRTQEDYKNHKSVPVEIINPENNDYSFILNAQTQRYDTRDFFFKPEEQTDSSVTMTMDLEGGAKWSLRYTLVKDSYMLRMEVLQSSMDKVIPTNISTMDFAWHQKIKRQEAGKQFEERNSALYWKIQGDNDDVSNLSENGTKDEKVQERIKWISGKSQFFSSVLIANQSFNGANFSSTAFDKDKNPKDYNTYLKDITINSQVEYQSTNPAPASFYFYFGPNRYALLSSYDKFSPKEDLHLTRLVSLGWTLFRWINSGIVMPVFNWLCKFGWSLGLVILVLTILLKLALWPLTYKSYMSQAKMKILQPDIQAINEKYPNQEDAMKKQQKTMELYKQAGANPMGGCLPMLLQMPFLIAMFWFFPSSIDLRGQSFLWAPDLSAPDAIISLPFSIPFLGDHLSIFCLLMTVTNIGYTYINMQSQSSSQMPGMKWMMYLMPLMFLVFFNTYAAGLSYYYFVSLLITIIQTYITRMMVKEDKVRAVMAENAKKPKKKSGFMARLEEAQRQAEQQKRAAAKGNNKRRR
ncbi:MAG: membrane protein insertase YidC [Muribaculaceae bacterium]|nr:membrane protein insertase YidC [Muribaculaceae bacterium]